MFLAVDNQLFSQSGVRAAPFGLDHLAKAMAGMQLFFCLCGWLGFFFFVDLLKNVVVL